MTLSPYESEQYIKALHFTCLEDVGNAKWMHQHEHLEQLNIQAHYSAIHQKHDEFIVDFLISYEKLYHEAVLCNLLEITMFNESALEGLYGVGSDRLSSRDDNDTNHALMPSDALLELIDFCVRKITTVNTGEIQANLSLYAKDHIEHERTEQTLSRQASELDLVVASASVDLLRFISDHIGRLPLALVTRLISTHDVLMAMVQLIETQWWCRRTVSNGTNRGGLEKFIDTKWQAVPTEDRMLLTKSEGQMWLTVYNLCMESSVRKKYNLNQYRKSQLLKLRKYLNQVLVDQLPLLVPLQRFIEELALYEPPVIAESPFVLVQQIPELRDQLLRRYSNGTEIDWQCLGQRCLESHLADDPVARREEITRMARTYNAEQFDELLESPTCAQCGRTATQRCSRCHGVWYCERACQLAAWPLHRTVCMVGVTSSASNSYAAEASSTSEHVRTTNFVSNRSKIEEIRTTLT